MTTVAFRFGFSHWPNLAPTPAYENRQTSSAAASSRHVPRCKIARLVAGLSRSWISTPCCRSSGSVILIASNASVEAPLESLKLVQGIREGGRDVGGRLAVQPLCLDQQGTCCRAPEGAS